MSTTKEPGFFRKVGTLFTLPLERRMEEEDALRVQRLAHKATEFAMDEIVRRVHPEDDGFLEVGLGSELGRELDQPNAEKLRQAALKAWLSSPHLKGYLRTMLRFVMGEGPKISYEIDGRSDEDEAKEAGWWARFKTFNDWDALEDEIPLRTWRDGESFLWEFVQEDDGPPEDWEPDDKVLTYLRGLNDLAEPFAVEDFEPAEVPAGMTFFRLIPPDFIRDPRNTVSQGVITSAKDVAHVLGYIYAPHDIDGASSIDDSRTKVRAVIPAKDVIHTKIGVDQDVKRGRSLLEILLKPDKQYQQWQQYRILLNLMRTSIALVKQYDKATPAQIATIRDKQAATRTDQLNDRKQKQFKPGTTIHASGADYKFISPDLQAQDAQHDGRSILLTEAAATGMAEYAITGDSSNSNFASTMVSESPMVREFQFWQDFWTPVFEEIYRRVHVNGAKESQNGLSEEQAQTAPIVTEWPPLIARDETKEATKNQILSDAGILSDETWTGLAGLTWEIEQMRLGGEPGRETLTPPDDEGDDE